MINILHPNFKPSCESTCLANDDYPPENLISSDFRKLSRGFMAYSVTKPPIDIIFTLQHVIDIHSIKLWSEIGSLKSTDFEVHIFSERNKNWRKVAACTNLTENVVIFDWANADDKESPNQFKRCQFYRHYNNRITTKQIKISIKQTKNRCTPVLKRIEIWAQPSYTCTNDEIQHIKNVWEKILYGGDVISTKHAKSDEENINSRESIGKTLSPNTLVIPDEFLDAITYEIMSIPMILPCGKTIDQSTMIKCNHTDETWGRMPIDPFTGQPYTELRKPIFDAILKSRIDEFLMRNAHHKETLTIPRTVGIASALKRNQSCLIVPRSPIIEISKRPRSLDDAVQYALQSITRFAKPLANSKIENLAVCVQCQAGLDNCLYKIDKCSHIICRSCLVSKASVQLNTDNNKKMGICDSCGESFRTCDVQRFYQTKLLT